MIESTSNTKISICVVAERCSEDKGLGDLAFCSKLFHILNTSFSPSIEVSVHPISEREKENAQVFNLCDHYQKIEKVKDLSSKMPTLILHGPVLQKDIEVGTYAEIWDITEYSFNSDYLSNLKRKKIRTGLGTDEMGIFFDLALYNEMEILEKTGKDCNPEKIENLKDCNLKKCILGDKSTKLYEKSSKLFFAYSHHNITSLKYLCKVLEIEANHEENLDICYLGKNHEKDFFVKQCECFLSEETIECEIVKWNSERDQQTTLFKQESKNKNSRKKIRIILIDKVDHTDFTNLLIASQPFVLITGDQSLGAALSMGKIIDSDWPEHKSKLKQNLVNLASQLPDQMAAHYISPPSFKTGSNKGVFTNLEANNFFGDNENWKAQLELLKNPMLKTSFRKLAKKIHKKYNLEKNIIYRVKNWVEGIKLSGYIKQQDYSQLKKLLQEEPQIIQLKHIKESVPHFNIISIKIFTKLFFTYSKNVLFSSLNYLPKPKLLFKNTSRKIAFLFRQFLYEAFPMKFSREF